jgi:hypothetical protein
MDKPAPTMNTWPLSGLTDSMQSPALDKPAPTMTVVSFYHRETGMFNGRHLMVSDPAMIPLNTPPDHIAIEGDHYDPLTQRVDVATGKVIDHIPPQPSEDHEWNTISRRWQLRPEITARHQARKAALARITELELKALRALREHALGKVGAHERLTAIDGEISQLREILRD